MNMDNNIQTLQEGKSPLHGLLTGREMMLSDLPLLINGKSRMYIINLNNHVLHQI